jgi:hypothetical protein
MFLRGMFLLLVFLVCSCARAPLRSLPENPKNLPVLDFVIDLDGTLVADEGHLGDASLVSYRGEYLRPYRWAGDLVQSLDELPKLFPGLQSRVHFFSAGDSARTRAILKQIILPNGRSAKDVAYSIWSRKNLKRGRKNLELLRLDLRRVFLIENDMAFVSRGQSQNALFVDWPEESIRGQDAPVTRENQLARIMGIIVSGIRTWQDSPSRDLREIFADIQWDARTGRRMILRSESFDPAIYRIGMQSFHAILEQEVTDCERALSRAKQP